MEIKMVLEFQGAWNSVVGWGTILQSQKVADSILIEVTGFLEFTKYPSSHIMALGFNQPLAEMSTRNLQGGEGEGGKAGWLEYEANTSTICESTV
jgi:hypothetical protein